MRIAARFVYLCVCVLKENDVLAWVVNKVWYGISASSPFVVCIMISYVFRAATNGMMFPWNYRQVLAHVAACISKHSVDFLVAV
jgi:hypothetical protein